jgi:hypothetical protein
MTRVEILPIPTGEGKRSYCAFAGDKHSQGETAGAALDALTAQLSEEELGTMVVVQNLRPDRFFTASQQARLTELMSRWRAAGDAGRVFPSDEQAELDELVNVELRASASRSAALADELGQ